MARGFARPEKYGRNAGVLGAGSDQSRARNESVNPSYSCSDCRELIPWTTFRRWGGPLIISQGEPPVAFREWRCPSENGAAQTENYGGKRYDWHWREWVSKIRRASCAVRFYSAPALGSRVSKILRPRGRREQLSTLRTAALGIGSRLLHFWPGPRRLTI